MSQRLQFWTLYNLTCVTFGLQFLLTRRITDKSFAYTVRRAILVADVVFQLETVSG